MNMLTGEGNFCPESTDGFNMAIIVFAHAIWGPSEVIEHQFFYGHVVILLFLNLKLKFQLRNYSLFDKSVCSHMYQNQPKCRCRPIWTSQASISFWTGQLSFDHFHIHHCDWHSVAEAAQGTAALIFLVQRVKFDLSLSCACQWGF